MLKSLTLLAALAASLLSFGVASSAYADPQAAYENMPSHSLSGDPYYGGYEAGGHAGH